MNIFGVALLAIVLGVIFGLWLRKAAADELKAGRKWFKVLIVLGVAGILIFAIMGESAAAVTCLTIAVVAGISLGKSLKIR